MSVIRTVVSWSVGKAFQSSEIETAEERAVQKCLAEPYVVNGVVNRSIDAPALTVPVAKLVKNDVEKIFLEKANIVQHRNDSTKAVLAHTMCQDWFSWIVPLLIDISLCGGNWFFAFVLVTQKQRTNYRHRRWTW